MVLLKEEKERDMSLFPEEGANTLIEWRGHFPIDVAHFKDMLDAKERSNIPAIDIEELKKILSHENLKRIGSGEGVVAFFEHNGIFCYLVPSSLLNAAVITMRSLVAYAADEDR